MSKSTSPDQLVLSPNPEWDAEDEVSGVLSVDAPVPADPAEAERIFRQSTIKLPDALDWTELVTYARKNSSGVLVLPEHADEYDFFSVEVPVTTILEDNQRLERLRLDLEFHVDGALTDKAVAFDLFPTSQTDVHEIMSGEAKIDIGEGLRYLLLATPAAVVANAAKCIKLDIGIPFKWTSETATVQSSNRMTNPTMWYVRDEAIQHGFSPSVVIRAPKQGKLTVHASLSGDLRQRGLLGKMVKAQFKLFEPRTYEVG
ncbi:MAG TPA: hypothetical protein VME23_12745 [Terracidiphilus sp.]|nr:hypothetical protein [Terracidiphilus sp.]